MGDFLEREVYTKTDSQKSNCTIPNFSFKDSSFKTVLKAVLEDISLSSLFIFPVDLSLFACPSGIRSFSSINGRHINHSDVF